jgi:tRNA(fMet)-specific endonuclease VapC
VALILDTNAFRLSSAVIGRLRRRWQEKTRHHLPVIAIGEYRYGLVRSRDRGRLGRLLDLLIHHSIVLPIEVETTAQYAVLREKLRQLGRPIPENDVWIAALARQHDLP